MRIMGLARRGAGLRSRRCSICLMGFMGFVRLIRLVRDVAAKSYRDRIYVELSFAIRRVAKLSADCKTTGSELHRKSSFCEKTLFIVLQYGGWMRNMQERR